MTEVCGTFAVLSRSDGIASGIGYGSTLSNTIGSYKKKVQSTKTDRRGGFSPPLLVSVGWGTRPPGLGTDYEVSVARFLNMSDTI